MTASAAKISPISPPQSIADPSTNSDIPVKRYALVDGTPFYLSPRYQDFKLLARGSYGVVISAYDNRNRRRVATKKVHNAFENVLDAKHLVRELRLMRIIDQVNVIKLLDIDPPVAFKGWNDVYIVSELLYDDLESILSKRKPLSARQVKFILWGLLCGLKYLHSVGVVHRDLKPGNLLLDKNCRVKIADLGLARVIEDDDVGLTKHVVTKSYRAPEVFLTPQTYTDKIDMWSVGVILFEMLAPHVSLFPKRAFKSQLDCILNVIGTPSDEDIREMPDHATWYVRKIAKRKRPRTVETRFVSSALNVDPSAIDLVSTLIQFNPKNRLSAEEALNHPYLADFHNEKLEVTAPEEHRRFFGQVEPISDHRHKLSKNELRKFVWNEMVSFHPEYSQL